VQACAHMLNFCLTCLFFDGHHLKQQRWWHAPDNDDDDSDVNNATAFKAKATTPQPRPKPRISEHATAVIWLKHGTKHSEISSNSHIQRITHIQMLVPCCHTSVLHFSNESDMPAQAKAKATTLNSRPRPRQRSTRPVVSSLRSRLDDDDR